MIPKRLRTSALLLLAILIETALVAMLRLQDLSRHVLPFLAWALAAGLFYLIAVWIVLAQGKLAHSRYFWLILGASLLFRLTLLPLAPTLSHQLYRQRWNGKIQSFNPPFNPYLFAPANPIFGPVRGPEYAAVPRKQLAAVSPPLALLIAGWNYRVFRNITGQKLLFIVCDLLIIWALASLLRQHGLPRERVLIYAWSPLAVLESAGNGHMITIALLLLILAIQLAGKKDRFSHIAMGSAAMVRLPVLLLLPAWRKQCRGRHWAWFLAPVVICSLPYLFFNKHFFLFAWWHNLATGFSLWLHAYANGGLSLLPQWFGSGLMLPVLVAAAAAFLTTLIWTARHRLDSAHIAMVVTAAALLLLPRLTPVDALWLLPWLVLFPEPAWLYFSVGVFLAYPPLLNAAYRNSGWQVCEYAPLYALLIWSWYRHRSLPRESPEGAVPA